MVLIAIVAGVGVNTVGRGYAADGLPFPWGHFFFMVYFLIVVDIVVIV